MADSQCLSEALNETILLNSPLPMGVYASTGRCILANEAYAQLVGETREALLEQSLDSIGYGQKSALHDDCLTALARQNPQHREINVANAFGKNVSIDVRILQIRFNGEDHLLVQFFDLTVRKRMEEELRHLAFQDSLTRLPNRRLLQDRLEQALRASKRENDHLAVLFIDLNNFKQLNDTHGHDVGDQLLVEVAGRLRQTVRDTDTVARHGGDEFVVLLKGLGAERKQASDYASFIADKIHQALSKDYLLGDIRYNGSASIGIKLHLGDEGNPDQILKEADKAMYEAKKGMARPDC